MAQRRVCRLEVGTSTDRREKRRDGRRRHTAHSAEKEHRQVRIEPLHSLFFFACTFLSSFAALPFGSMPVAPAFFAALLAFDEAAAWGAAGIIAGALTGVFRGVMMQGWQLPECIVISLMMPVARRCFKPKWHCWLYALSAFAAALPTLFVQSDRFTAIFQCVELGVGVLALTPVFTRIVLMIQGRESAGAADDCLCMLVLAVCMLAGLNGLGTAGGFLVRVVSVALTGACAYAGGGVAGVACGGAVGLALALLGRPAHEIVLLLLTGFFCALARGGTRNRAAAGVGVAALCTCAFFGLEFLRWGTLLSILCAAAALTLCPQSVLIWMEKRISPALGEDARAELSRRYTYHSVRDVACSLREMTDALPAPHAPQREDEARVERFAQGFCEQCGKRMVCWNDEFAHTKQWVSQMLRPLPERSDEEVRQGAEAMGCERSRHFAEARRGQLMQERMENAAYTRCIEQHGTMKRQLGALAQAVTRLSGELCEDVELDNAVSEQIMRALTRAGIQARVIYAVRSGGRLRVMVERKDESTIGSVQEAIAAAAKTPVRCIYDELLQTELYFEQDAPLDAEVAAASMKKAGEEVAGDSNFTHRLRGGRCLVALSDGMGSGSAARRESQAALRLLYRCFKAGYSRAQALKAVNSLMVSCAGEDVFATLDLCLLDLYEGRATIEKLGACTSFLVHDGKCEALEADTLPMGMLLDVQPCSRSVEVDVGDLLIFMTDGVADTFPQGQEGLMLAIDRLRAQSPQTISRALLERALRVQGGQAGDDMTVLCVRIVESGMEEYRQGRKRG